MNKHIHLNYIQDQRLFEDVSMYIDKNLLSNLLRKESTLFTYWTDFQRRPKKVMKE